MSTFLNLRYLIVLLQTFSTPRYHPKSQPFVDHVFTFTIADNRIWFRNYQVKFLSQSSWPTVAFLGKMILL